MKAELKGKLKTLPNSPGVYFHKSVSGEIIYVGKAAILKRRVKQYFQKTKLRDLKTEALVAEIDDVDWMVVDSEVDALFLEAEMVRRYMPRYNILLRDDKSQSFVRIDMKNEWPTVSFTRNPMDDGAEYFGPFYNSFALKKALRYLRRIFPYLTTPRRPGQSRLNEDLGLSPKLTEGSELYKTNLRRLISYIKGNRTALISELEKDMKTAAREQQFELAAELRNRLYNMKELQRRVMFGDEEFMDISKDAALQDLAELFGLDSPPRRIEGFDISHMSGTNVVASMVVFQNGASSRADYRKFKTRFDRNDDFANMQETITRRLSQKNLKAWGQPNLVLIDGGKGQLDAALQARNAQKVNCPFVGIAKKHEQIVVKVNGSGVEVDKSKLEALGGWLDASDDFMLVNLPHHTHIVKLLQRIRDESHRFAVSYHTVLKRAKQTKSLLDDIPGVGPATRKKLINKFGSGRGVREASLKELEAAVGKATGQRIHKHLRG